MRPRPHARVAAPAAPWPGGLLVVTVAVLGALALLVSGCRGAPAARASEPAAARTTQSGPFRVTTLSVPYARVNRPQKVGDAVYLSVSRGPDAGDDLIRYDLASSEVETIVASPDPEQIGWFVVNEKWLVWSVGLELYARSLDSGAEQLVSRSRDLYGPALSGDRIVWDDLSPERTHQITVRDLVSKQTTVVAPLALADLYNDFPAWDGDRAVWTDVVDGVGRYRAYDTRTGRLEDYPLAEGAFRYPGYALPAGERIYSINFDNVDEWNWTRQAVGYYSVTEGRFVPIERPGFIANSLRVFGEWVALLDDGQRLSVRSASATGTDGEPLRPVPGLVDAITSSGDTLIAATAAPESGTTTLTIVEARRGQ